jgi:hypothetical protein
MGAGGLSERYASQVPLEAQVNFKLEDVRPKNAEQWISMILYVH